MAVKFFCDICNREVQGLNDFVVLEMKGHYNVTMQTDSGNYSVSNTKHNMHLDICEACADKVAKFAKTGSSEKMIGN